MFILNQLSEFRRWLSALKNVEYEQRIYYRLQRFKTGNFGDVKPVFQGKIWEARLHFGAGFRVYYTVKDNYIIFLLIGGDKSTQEKDIDKAIELYKKYFEG